MLGASIVLTDMIAIFQLVGLDGVKKTNEEEYRDTGISGCNAGAIRS
jgi:hypothetical protein